MGTRRVGASRAYEVPTHWCATRRRVARLWVPDIGARRVGASRVCVSLKQHKADGKSRRSGKRRKDAPHASGKHKRGVDRHPLLQRSDFTPQCLAKLKAKDFEPKKMGWLPDGRWVVETLDNGRKLKFTDFLVSFD